MIDPSSVYEAIIGLTFLTAYILPGLSANIMQSANEPAIALTAFLIVSMGLPSYSVSRSAATTSVSVSDTNLSASPYSLTMSL